jgi:hypothetical protein
VKMRSEQGSKPEWAAEVISRRIFFSFLIFLSGGRRV